MDKRSQPGYLANMPMTRLTLIKVLCSLLRRPEENKLEIEQLAQRLEASIAATRQGTEKLQTTGHVTTTKATPSGPTINSIIPPPPRCASQNFRPLPAKFTTRGSSDAMP